MSIPEIMMREACLDCAFRPGTDARKAPLQAEKANLCVLAGVPFHCHEHPRTFGTDKVMCKGFVDAFTARMQNQYYDRLPDWKKQIFLTCLDAIESAENGVMPDLPQLVKEKLVEIRQAEESTREATCSKS